MRARTYIHRIALQGSRKALAYQKKYAKAINNALVEQARYAADNGGVLNDRILNDVINDLYSVVAVNFANEQRAQLQRDYVAKARNIFLNPFREWITMYILRTVASRVAGINSTTRARIQEAIAIGVDQGLEWRETSKLIMQKVTGLGSASRATTIARTETANAINAGKEQGGEEFAQETGETVYKLWIHRFAKEPRSWHSALDNDNAIPKSDKFVVTNPATGNTELMDRPHSDGASAENTINCSCTVIYVSERMAAKLRGDVK